MPKDYLTSLPPELFDYICDLVHLCDAKTPFASRHLYLGSISKAFLPSARRRVFPSITVDDESQAVGLLHVFVASPGAARSVTSLRLDLPENALSKEIIKASVLDKALSNLACVERVSLKGASRLAKRLLSPRRDGSLASLRSLSVTSRFEGCGDPFAPSFYLNLGRYRALWFLTLNVQSKPEGLSVPAKALDRITRTVKPAHVRSLDLRGAAKGAPGANAFVAWLRPESLSIDGRYGGDSPLSARLRNLPRSVQLLHLNQETTLSEDVRPALSHLRHLNHLSLWAGLDCATILPLLAHHLPNLMFLGLQVNDSFTAHHLLQILSGPDKVVKLRALFMSTPSDSDLPARHSLMPERLIEVVQVAERENVKLVGEMFEKAKEARDASL